MLRLVAACSALLFLSTLAGAQTSGPLLALKGQDPVELIGGKEVPGDPSLTVTSGRFVYRFANAANKAAFEKAQASLGIQFGGACMKMGPLSGYGSPERWAVYDKKIYLFASESCRTNFRANPVKFIDTADEPARGTEAQMKKGSELMAKAVAATGGDEKLKALTSYQVRTKLSQPQRDGTTFVYHRHFVMSFTDQVAAEWEMYDKTRYGWVVSPKKGYRTFNKEWEKVDSQVHEFMMREAARQPLLLLHAWMNGHAKAVATGPTTIDNRKLENVALSLFGATTTLGIDPNTGVIDSVAYKGRAAAGIAQVERQLSGYKTVQGISLPFVSKTLIDGKPGTGTKAEIESITINEAIPQELIRKPAP
jgi:YHS domain-containing protein